MTILQVETLQCVVSQMYRPLVHGLLLVACLWLWATGSAFSEEIPVSNTQVSGLVSNTAILDNDYILGAGDEVYIEDELMGDLAIGQARILTDGSVDMPLIGQVKLAGISVDEAEKLLNEKYKEFYVTPAITIQVLHQHPIRVYVEGAVNNPGVYVSGKNLKPGNEDKFELGSSNTFHIFYQFYLTDALIQAGGLKHNANLQDIEIKRIHPTRQTIHVNLWELLKSGMTIQDLALHEQDTIVVGTLPRDQMLHEDDWKILARTNLSQNHFNVNVIGAVNKPGTYQVLTSDNILNAIAEAGGLTPLASPKKVFLLRTNAAGQVFKKRVDVSDPRLMGKKQGDWLALLPDDVIFVDESAPKKALNFGRGMFDRASNAALLPYFTQLMRDEE